VCGHVSIEDFLRADAAACEGQVHPQGPGQAGKEVSASLTTATFAGQRESAKGRHHVRKEADRSLGHGEGSVVGRHAILAVNRQTHATPHLQKTRSFPMLQHYFYLQ